MHEIINWSRNGQTINVKNPSPYVVRLAQNITFLPSGAKARLKTYILPGETLNVSIKTPLAADTSVRFYPASRYGIEVPSFTSPLVP